jgi:2-polyprenyl-3-methyl-5-hydroxy-6-metoxy-1,4-benzoquinol methylase
MPPECGKLSSKNHWNQGFEQVSLPRTIHTAHYNNFRFDSFFKKVLPKGPLRFLEVGCGASAWLVYFAKEFGYRVEGLDYSELGCKLARENLRLNHVDGKISCRDISSLDAREMGTFDLIFSYGVVEHFEDPAKILSILTQLLAPGGRMIVVVPNLKGIYGSLQRWWSEPVYRIHKIITAAELKSDLIACGCHSVTAEYFGTFFLHVVNWSAPASGGTFRRVLPQIAGRFDRYVSGALRKLHIEIESQSFSPYLVAVGAKPNASSERT